MPLTSSRDVPRCPRANLRLGLAMGLCSLRLLRLPAQHLLLVPAGHLVGALLAALQG